MQMMSAGATSRILLTYYPAQVREQKNTVTVAANSRQFSAHSGQDGEGTVPPRKPKDLLACSKDVCRAGKRNASNEYYQ